MFQIRERLEHAWRQREVGYVGEKVIIHRETVRDKVQRTGVKTRPINFLIVLSL